MTSTLTSPSPVLGVPQRPMTAIDERRPPRRRLRRTRGATRGARANGSRRSSVVTCLFFGLGLLIYVAAWFFVPRWGEDVEHRATTRRVTPRVPHHLVRPPGGVARAPLVGQFRSPRHGGRLVATRC